jgi:hypothetical protein
METKLTKKDVLIQDGLSIYYDGINEPAWKHEDGTIVSHWDNLEMLLIQNSDGTIERLCHDVALELGYEFN